MSELEYIENAWKRIGKTEDGKTARKLLVQCLLTCDPIDAQAGALLVSNAQRNFATKLISLLDAELAHDDRADDTDAKRFNREPVPFGRNGSRRRVS